MLAAVDSMRATASGPKARCSVAAAFSRSPGNSGDVEFTSAKAARWNSSASAISRAPGTGVKESINPPGSALSVSRSRNARRTLVMERPSSSAWCKVQTSFRASGQKVSRHGWPSASGSGRSRSSTSHDSQDNGHVSRVEIPHLESNSRISHGSPSRKTNPACSAAVCFTVSSHASRTRSIGAFGEKRISTCWRFAATEPRNIADCNAEMGTVSGRTGMRGRRESVSDGPWCISRDCGVPGKNRGGGFQGSTAMR